MLRVRYALVNGTFHIEFTRYQAKKYLRTNASYTHLNGQGQYELSQIVARIFQQKAGCICQLLKFRFNSRS